MSNIPKLILENPFRIVGVYANSPKKSIVANKGKAMAFLKVNRIVEYPLDLKGILPPLSRTLDDMNAAEAHLAIAKEQIKYAQFWFLDLTPLDDVAFNHLLAGDIEKAKEMWSKQENPSSLQNKIVCYLIEEKPWLAVKAAEKLYSNFGDIYINKVDASSTLQMSASDLLHQFIDSLGEEIGMQKLLGYTLSEETIAYISGQTVGPLINKISVEVERTKKVDHKDPKARLDAANELISSTKEAYIQLKSILPSDDTQLQMIADKLGLEILQCGIDYFNNSSGDTRHQGAMKVQRYAQSIVMGSHAKQRCDENVRILQELIEKLPPAEVKQQQNNIHRLITSFVNRSVDFDDILNFLRDTISDLVAIKEILGKEHSFYRRQATLIAQTALSQSIDLLNDVQENEFPRLKGFGRSEAIKKLREAFAASWKTMLWIELLETDTDFKNKRLYPNKATLKNILDQIDAFDDDFFSLFPGESHSVFIGCACNINVDKYIYFTEAEMYEECTSISACQKYLQKFPDGSHIESVRAKLAQLEDDKLFEEATTIERLNGYLSKYPNGIHCREARAKLAIQIDKEIKELCKQIDSCRNMQNCIALKAKTDKYKSALLNEHLDDKLYSLCNSSDDCQGYLEVFGSSGRHSEEAKRIIHRKERNKKILLIVLVTLLVLFFGWAFFYSQKISRQINAERTERMNSLFDYAIANHHADSCIAFLSTYNYYSSKEQEETIKSVLKRSVEMEADSLLFYHNNSESLQDFVKKYASFQYVNVDSAITKVKERITEIAEEKAAAEKIAKQQKEKEMYGTDAKAWNTATSINTIDAYRDYLSRYPQGKHAEVANKKIIDLEVQQVVNSGNYGQLPPSEKISYGTGTNSTIHIRSRCDRTITIMYSGKSSTKIIVPPHGSRTAVIASGSYRVVATASGVRPYYGTENLTGGDYESEYYISTSLY